MPGNIIQSFAKYNNLKKKIKTSSLSHTENTLLLQDISLDNQPAVVENELSDLSNKPVSALPIEKPQKTVVTKDEPQVTEVVLSDDADENENENESTSSEIDTVLDQTPKLNLIKSEAEIVDLESIHSASKFSNFPFFQHNELMQGQPVAQNHFHNVNVTMSATPSFGHKAVRDGIIGAVTFGAALGIAGAVLGSVLLMPGGAIGGVIGLAVGIAIGICIGLAGGAVAGIATGALSYLVRHHTANASKLPKLESTESTPLRQNRDLSRQYSPVDSDDTENDAETSEIAQRYASGWKPYINSN